jgi:hypothetical protein
MTAIIKKIDRLPLWAWTGLGAGAGTLTAGAISLLHLLGISI